MKYPPKARTKKGWMHQTKEAPLPIPIQSLTSKPASNSRWFYYTAKLIDGSVLVQKEGDKHFLYRMGFFGKGNLSRGKPEHSHFVSSYQGHQRKSLPATERRFQQKRFQKVRQHRYERHLLWSKLKEKGQLDSEKQRGVKPEDTPSTSKDDSLIDPLIEQEHSDELVDNRSKVKDSLRGSRSKVTGSLGQEELARTIESSDQKETKEDNIGDTNSEQTENKEEQCKQSHYKAWDVDVNEWTLPTQSSKMPGSSSRQPLNEEKCKVSLNTDICRTGSESGDHRKGVHINYSGVDGQGNYSGVDGSQQFETDSANSLAIKRNFTDRGLRGEVKRKLRKKVRGNEMRCRSDDDNDCRMSEDEATQEQCKVSKSDSELTQLNVTAEPCHRRPEDEETAYQTKEKRPKTLSKRGNISRKPDPYPIHELLQLSYEETFFLSYGLGCLSLLKPSRTSAQENPMNLMEIWKEFLILKPRFLATYACYHYYRSKGWVPRCGIKYGCDFVIYKKGPSFYHSSFAVLAHLVTEEGSELTSALTSWYNFTGFSRIIENAAKDVILCYVTYPEQFTELQLKSPACIPHLKVHEICIKRWRPTRERESREYQSLIS